MSAEHDRQAKGKRIMAEIVAIPAILAFPPEVYAQLDQLCELRGFTHHQLVGEALRSQEGRWLKLGKELLTQRPTGEIEVWPEDPLEILARVVLVRCMQLFSKSYHDPVGYEEEKKDAPAEWSFCSIEEQDEPADWWKSAE